MFRKLITSQICKSRLTGQPFRLCSTTMPHSASTHAKRALVAIANGSEELEAVTIIDILRRAGIDVTLASVESHSQITASRGVKIVADKLLDDIDENAIFDAIVLPGGMPGAETLGKNQQLLTMLKEHKSEGKLIAAICASPAVVLGKNGLLDGKKATCYPGHAFEQYIKNFSKDDVVQDGNILTSRGPGTAVAFALAITHNLAGKDTAHDVAKGLLYKHA